MIPPVVLIGLLAGGVVAHRPLLRLLPFAGVVSVVWGAGVGVANDSVAVFAGGAGLAFANFAVGVLVGAALRATASSIRRFAHRASARHAR